MSEFITLAGMPFAVGPSDLLRALKAEGQLAEAVHELERYRLIVEGLVRWVNARTLNEVAVDLDEIVSALEDLTWPT